MFIIDAPFVSNYLKQTLQDLKIPVIQTAYAEETLAGYTVNFISEFEAVQAYTSEKKIQFHTNSENALEWILAQFPASELAFTVGQVKDKVRFRDVLAQIHTTHYYKGCPYRELQNIDSALLPFPVILKPSIGFFSLGVQRIDSPSHWVDTLSKLDSLTSSYEGIYPSSVLDNSTFIIEEVIPGEEFAVDCYFDEQGQAVILNMMKHLFASGDDVNDRVYITSSAIMEQYLEPVQNYLNKLGTLFELRNFQAHIEIRIAADEIVAIEINPLRFGGWCSTADLAQYAWDMNLYEALVKGVRPDWDHLKRLDPELVYALVVLNNSTGVAGKEIASFDYDTLLTMVHNPLELRKTDFHKFPLFGFLMCKVPANDMSDLHKLLHSDLKEFITLN
ncbi:MAG: ATP-grasp domain-containing protein [FCB group bacterium]|nr:ATP-grasp domain-containing protein [FCB group bacterium]MBL7028732.1 ATP-grasp domain-containing protein [Candidatus Neomarinimicrobiota bacterium]MBL7120664.1 ATP-grasp domain-containing protein [Candidatus Neomarinimicrobiota bacterium]